MNLKSSTQKNLYEHNYEFINLVNLHSKNRLPNQILLSGERGIGKCTLAYHFINYVLSLDENYSYDLKNFKINNENKSYKLTQNKTNPNLNLIDVIDDKKNIDINQIRDLISSLNKSSFNSKPRFVLIDNIEFLNLNSINALLKILEEPTLNTHFILINNNKKLLSTIKSRCLNYKITLKNKDSVNIKYVKSIQSEETGGWRFNEQMIQMEKGEQLDSALKRMDEVSNLVDIDLSQFSKSKDVVKEDAVETKEPENITVNLDNGSNEEE